MKKIPCAEGYFKRDHVSIIMLMEMTMSRKEKKLRTISAVDAEMAIVLSRMSIAGSVKA